MVNFREMHEVTLKAKHGPDAKFIGRLVGVHEWVHAPFIRYIFFGEKRHKVREMYKTKGGWYVETERFMDEEAGDWRVIYKGYRCRVRSEKPEPAVIE